MKTFRLTAILCALAGAGQARANPTLHGLLGGVNLIYESAGSPTVITPGSGYIDGVVFQLQNPPNRSPVPLLLTGFLTVNASTAYYCYVVDGNAAVTGTPFLPNTVSFVCSTTGPTLDGHPSAAIAGAPDGGAPFTSTTSALFVGSIITDASKNVVPFYRNGQQVLLNQLHNAFTFATPGFTAPDPIDPGAGTAAAVLDFGPPPVVYPNEQSYTVSPLPLLSLSAVLFDFQVVNTDTAPHNVSLLDPASHAIACAGGNCTKACEGEIKIDRTPHGTVAADATYRASMNVDSNGAVWVGMDTAPGAGGDVRVLPVLRGYVEPIKHLFGR